MSEPESVVIKVLSSLTEMSAKSWDACANPPHATYNPFISHGFLNALEQSGSASPASGWAPRHLALEDGAGGFRAVMPLYAKSHSQGEYVFDQGWATAYERAGGRYYPKLQASAPFTPVSGRRMLVRGEGEEALCEKLLLQGAVELCRAEDASSIHITFATEGEWARLGRLGLLQRIDQQFHWTNAGYHSYEDFLASLASRKRKALRKERREALSEGLSVTWLTGAGITEAHWDAFYAFYTDTGARKWGRPYLNREAFSLLGAALGERILLIMASRAGRPIAGALNFIGGDALYGRYFLPS